MASTTKTTERIPQHYFDYKADDRFPELGQALKVYHVSREKVEDLQRDLNYSVSNTDTLDPAIRVLDNLDNDLIYGCSGFKKSINKFNEKYLGVVAINEDISCSFQKALEVLREAKLKQLAEIPKLQEELKAAQFIKDRDWKTYQDLDAKYKEKWQKLLDAQTEKDAKKSQEEVAV